MMMDDLTIFHIYQNSIYVFRLRCVLNIHLLSTKYFYLFSQADLDNYERNDGHQNMRIETLINMNESSSKEEYVTIKSTIMDQSTPNHLLTSKLTMEITTPGEEGQKFEIPLE